MSLPETAIRHLTADESWQLLHRSKVGRLAVSVAGHPDVFPVNYVVDGRTIVFKTSQGSKLLEATINPHVAFEADVFDRSQAWSVVAHGEARVVDTEAEELAVSELPLISWLPTVKHVYVRIEVSELNGRRFAFGEEPEFDLL